MAAIGMQAVGRWGVASTQVAMATVLMASLTRCGFRITPFLWFDTQAEEAAKRYTSIFPNSRIGDTMRYDAEAAKVSGRPAGSVMTIDFELDGQMMTALNGGPHFTFNEAVSLVVNCHDQAEVDFYWDRLTEGGDRLRS